MFLPAACSCSDQPPIRSERGQTDSGQEHSNGTSYFHGRGYSNCLGDPLPTLLILTLAANQASSQRVSERAERARRSLAVECGGGGIVRNRMNTIDFGSGSKPTQQFNTSLERFGQQLTLSCWLSNSDELDRIAALLLLLLPVCP